MDMDMKPNVSDVFLCPQSTSWQDLCDKVTSSQSHNLHKLLGFHHLACCTLLLRYI